KPTTTRPRTRGVSSKATHPHALETTHIHHPSAHGHKITQPRRHSEREREREREREERAATWRKETELAWRQEASRGAGRELQGMEDPAPADPPRIFWKSRRSANGRSLQQEPDKDATKEVNEQAQEESMKIDDATDTTGTAEDVQPDPKANLSEKRKALFEPLEPVNGKRSAEMLLPPPDFEPASYPKGWLVGKKRKLVNVDVVESMRRIAIQEMNRKVYNLSSGLTVHTNMISCSVQMLFFLLNTSILIIRMKNPEMLDSSFCL
ncbi:unnamed protein product, partial [Urochloa humidicola]